MAGRTHLTTRVGDRGGARRPVLKLAVTILVIVAAMILGGWDGCNPSPESVTSRHLTWAVGANGTIVHTANGGHTWTAQVSGTTTTLRGVDFADTSSGWAVGAVGTILHTSNGGATWSAQTSGTTADLYAVDFVDATHGWAVGWAEPVPGGTVLATSDGGQTWAAQNVGVNPPWFNSVSFADAQHGCAAGIGPSADKIYVTGDGGQTWSPKPSGAAYFSDVSFVDASHAWAVGVSGAVVASSDGGASWGVQSSGASYELYGVDFADAGRGIAVGDAASGGTEATALNTTNGGATWKPAFPGTSSVLHDVSFADADWAWAVGDQGTICATRNAGDSWTGDSSGTSADLYGVSAVLAPEPPSLATAAGAREAKTADSSLDDMVLTWANGMKTTVFGVQNPQDASQAIGLAKTQVPLPAKYGAKSCFAFKVTTSLVYSRAEVTIPASALPGMGVPATSISKLVAFSVSPAGAIQELTGAYEAATKTSTFAAPSLSTTFLLATDTKKPVAKALANASGKRGKIVKLRYSVADGRPTVVTTITISKGKKVRATVKVGTVATNKKLVCSFKCKLPAGTYTWTVKATDRLGNASTRTKASTKTLIVKR